MVARAYLDWNATAPLRAEARAAMIGAMDVVGNPSSVHGEGRAAKSLVERARGDIASAIGCKPREIVFVAGATEAASFLGRWGGAVNVDETAHDALRAYHGKSGSGPSIWAQGLANSETGVISEIERTADRVLVDLTQAVGRMPVAFEWLDVDFAILSAHKFGGPKGVGALVVREGVDVPALSLGGGQEMGRRAGTENLIGIVGMAAALGAAMNDLDAGVWREVAQRRDAMEAELQAQVGEAIIVGLESKRLPNTSCILTPGWKGETQVMQMDLAGFAISAGSACSSGKVKASGVLQAMGYDERQAASAIRVSIGPETCEEDLSAFVAAFAAAHKRHAARAA